MPEVDGKWITFEEREKLTIKMIKHHIKNLQDGLITFDEAKDKIFDTVWAGKYYLLSE